MSNQRVEAASGFVRGFRGRGKGTVRPVGYYTGEGERSDLDISHCFDRMTKEAKAARRVGAELRA